MGKIFISKVLTEAGFSKKEIQISL